MMSKQEALAVLARTGAVITKTHVVYTSGRHGSAYINKDAVYPHTQATSKLCRAIAENFFYANVDAVIAPAMGGIILSQWVAYHLTELSGHEALGIYAEKAHPSGTRKRRGRQIHSRGDPPKKALLPL